VAYHFHHGESVPEGVRRIAAEQLEGAIQELTSGKQRDEAIHEARKSVKKTRALLRLVRYELGEVFAGENVRLRDAGHALSEFRDAAAAIETFDQLREKFRGEFGASPLAGVRRGLLLEKKRAERAGNVKQAAAKISARLSGIARRVNRWPLDRHGFEAIAPGLERTFRDGRKAMKAARRRPRPENFHEWRKRVKDHWYHVRLLEHVWDEMMKGLEASLKQLEDWLGTDHNLEVLRAKVNANPARYGPKADIDTLMHLIDRYQKELRGCSLEMGDRIYLERPSQFLQRMERLWEAW